MPRLVVLAVDTKRSRPTRGRRPPHPKVVVDAAHPPGARSAPRARCCSRPPGGPAGHAAADGSLAALVKARRAPLDGAGRGAARVDAPLDLRRAGGGSRAAARGAGRAAGRPATSMAGRDAPVDYITGASAVELIAPPKAAAARGSTARRTRRRRARQGDGRARLGDAARRDGVPRRPAARLRRGRLRRRARRRRRRRSVVPLTAPGEITAAAGRPRRRALDPLVAASLAALAPELRARFGDVFAHPPAARCGARGDETPCPAHDRPRARSCRSRSTTSSRRARAACRR